MPDILTKKQRSYCMSRIRGSKTKPELKFKKIMEIMGFQYQPRIYGKPDFANKKEKIAMFIDGCFWHGCQKHFSMPKNNRKFWENKIKRNMQRDKTVNLQLRKAGWRVIRIWEHKVKKL
jgi:DNA mismatch endonuclease (patch repair protein)